MSKTINQQKEARKQLKKRKPKEEEQACEAHDPGVSSVALCDATHANKDNHHPEQSGVLQEAVSHSEVKDTQTECEIQQPQKMAGDAQPAGNSYNKANYLSNLIIGILFLLSLILNIGLFIMLRNYSLIQAAMAKNFEDIKKSLRENENQAGDLSAKLKGLSTDFQGINIKLSEARTSMGELANNTEIQKAAIDNLTKAKNTLFNRISDIEAGLEQVKVAAPPKVETAPLPLNTAAGSVSTPAKQ